MKIMFVSAASSIHTVRWVNALIERGHQVHLISLPNHRAGKDAINDIVQITYLPVSGGKGYYLNALYIKKIYNKIQPDIVNVHYASGYGTLARIARIPQIILSVWGSDVYEFPYESKLKRWILNKNLRYASKIASTSNTMAEQVRRLLGQNELQITVTPFGVDTLRFKKMDRQEKNVFTVGIIKTLEAKYGIETVIKAFDEFMKRNSKISAQLLIYGKGALKDELVALCKKLGIEDYVQFQGYIANDKVPFALNQMDTACLGSEHESFGVAAVEAMACEVPVVATDVPGFREVLVHEETGFIVPRYDYKAMADYIELLYKDSNVKCQMGKKGRERVLELYDWGKNVDTMLELYKQQCEQR